MAANQPPTFPEKREMIRYMRCIVIALKSGGKLGMLQSEEKDNSVEKKKV